MTVMIGIDPHKASHTAVVIDNTECVLDELRVRACSNQTDELRAWAAPFPDRVWAIESDRGLGYLLAQQLVAAGEIVIDVPAVSDQPRPDASNLNSVGGQTIPNSVIASVSATGEVCFYVYGTTHLSADLSGYFPT